MWSSVIRAVIFGVVLGLLGAVWSVAMHFHGFSYAQEIWMEHLFTGTVAGGLVFFYMEERRLRTSNRMEELAFLNHHIRNALTAINLSRYADDDSMRLQIVADASMRIENTLRKMSEQEHVALDPSSPQE